jgi:hypothetical protein
MEAVVAAWLRSLHLLDCGTREDRLDPVDTRGPQGLGPLFLLNFVAFAALLEIRAPEIAKIAEARRVESFWCVNDAGRTVADNLSLYRTRLLPLKRIHLVTADGGTPANVDEARSV